MPVSRREDVECVARMGDGAPATHGSRDGPRRRDTGPRGPEGDKRGGHAFCFHSRQGRRPAKCGLEVRPVAGRGPRGSLGPTLLCFLTRVLIPWPWSLCRI